MIKKYAISNTCALDVAIEYFIETKRFDYQLLMTWFLALILLLKLIITFTLVKRVGINFFLRSHFFGLTQSFRFFGHVIAYFR